ncbi:PTS sugar transporter subunit IIA [Brenneria corticis]|uniref:PTS ascorbate transporter subunit IIA n=1 Tax=Brenneria corticis TaxID=2173106 RepID=A0A2U1U2T9_9GAMM|nr:PTS sugar transporter subunit IIA [Brenneria sp. CFCC 11842]PWC15964.1 PTS ascorbate transporter subunit IIA [Brenneria sp. CFCC 11842]
MLNDWLTQDSIQICDRADDWRQAVALAAAPLIAKGAISDSYVPAILRQYDAIGPYFVLAPGIAMPHARPEEGALALGLSLLLVREGVIFHSADHDPVRLIVMLSAPDGNSHIELIAQLAELFSCDEAITALFAARTVEEVLDIIHQY